MRSLFALLVFAAGALVPLQAALNNRVRDAVGSPILGALVSFVVGSLALIALWMAGFTGRGRPAGLLDIPPGYWLGGACGAAIVTAAIVGIPRIGAGGFIVMTILGQLVASLVFDHFGVLGIPRNPATLSRVAGAVLVLAGAMLVVRK